MKCVAGLDPSLTSFGIALWFEDGQTMSRTVKTRAAGPDVVDRMKRHCAILKQVFDVIEIHDPSVVVVEDYLTAPPTTETGHQQRGHIDRHELGGLLRFELWSRNHVQYELNPMSLKKFAFPEQRKLCLKAKSQQGKELLAAEIKQYWRITCRNYDEYDAMVCARIAACIAGLVEPMCDRQREVLRAVTNNWEWLPEIHAYCER